MVQKGGRVMKIDLAVRWLIVSPLVATLGVTAAMVVAINWLILRGEK